MDEWQKHCYEKMRDFIGKVPETVVGEEVKIGINRKEAYIFLKALEDQNKYLNPIFHIGPQENK